MRFPEAPPADQEINELLAKMLEDKNKLSKLMPYLKIVNEKYLPWDNFLVRFQDLTAPELKALWGLTTLMRHSIEREIHLGDIKFIYVQTPWIERVLHNMDVEISNKILPENDGLSTYLKKRYLISSIMEEAIASSQLEGAATTHDVAKKMLQENRMPRNKDERMIYNNYVTMRYIKERVDTDDQLTVEFIKEVHRRITEGTLENKSQEGVFRTDNEVVVKSRDDGKVVHVPPDFDKIEAYMQQLCVFANSDQAPYYLHPIVKAIIIHYIIGFVHPFYDGNGRTARALFYWYALSQHSYDYLEYISISTAIRNAPAQYMMAYIYSEKDKNDVTYFVMFNLDKLGIAIKSFQQYVERKKTENNAILAAIRADQRLNMRQADIMARLSKAEGRITIKEVKEVYRVTYQTARSDLLKLVDFGYMDKFTLGKHFIFTISGRKISDIHQNK